MVDIYMHRDLNLKAAIFMLFKVHISIFHTVRGPTDAISSILNLNDVRSKVDPDEKYKKLSWILVSQYGK